MFGQVENYGTRTGKCYGAVAFWKNCAEAESIECFWQFAFDMLCHGLPLSLTYAFIDPHPTDFDATGCHFGCCDGG
jgi:hypothetical protein